MSFDFRISKTAVASKKVRLALQFKVRGIREFLSVLFEASDTSHHIVLASTYHCFFSE